MKQRTDAQRIAMLERNVSDMALLLVQAAQAMNQLVGMVMVLQEAVLTDALPGERPTKQHASGRH